MTTAQRALAWIGGSIVGVSLLGMVVAVIQVAREEPIHFGTPTPVRPKYVPRKAQAAEQLETLSPEMKTIVFYLWNEGAAKTGGVGRGGVWAGDKNYWLDYQGKSKREVRGRGEKAVVLSLAKTGWIRKGTELANVAQWFLTTDAEKVIRKAGI